jgi:hypothetical protein
MVFPIKCFQIISYLGPDVGHLASKYFGFRKDTFQNLVLQFSFTCNTKEKFYIPWNAHCWFCHRHVFKRKNEQKDVMTLGYVYVFLLLFLNFTRLLFVSGLSNYIESNH